MNTKKLALMSMFLGLAMIIFIIEAQIPAPVPIPGIKLGLANTVNLITLYIIGRKESFVLLIMRIILCSIFAGNAAGLLYSLMGGLVSFLLMGVMSLFLKENRMWIVSEFGAIGHNIGQIMMAMMLVRTVQIIWYLPVLMISAVVTGLFTGLLAQMIVNRLRTADVIRSFTEDQNNA